MFKHPPKVINGIVGYRTSMSKKNKDTWAFAHDYCGKLWIKLGAITLIPTAIVQIPFAHSSDDVIGVMTLIIMAVQLVVIACSIMSVEKALKNTFDKNGIRINI